MKNTKLNQIRRKSGMKKREKRNRALNRKRAKALRTRKRLTPAPVLANALPLEVAVSSTTPKRKSKGLLGLVAVAAVALVLAAVGFGVANLHERVVKVPAWVITGGTVPYQDTHPVIQEDGSTLLEPDWAIEGGAIYHWDGEEFVETECKMSDVDYTPTNDDPPGFQGF